METKDIIKTGRQRLGMTHQAFADAVGVSRGAVQQWEKGDTAPTRRHQPKVAEILDISVAELMGHGALSMETTDPGAGPAQAQPVAIDLENNPDWPSVRRVSIKAQAGITGFAVESVDDLPPIVFRADWYKNHGYRPERLLALRVAGESMVPSLWPGDLIVVNTDNTAPKDGVAALVAYYGEVTVKRMQMDAGQWWLTSDNPDQRRHARKLCDDNTVIIGEVIYKQSERV